VLSHFFLLGVILRHLIQRSEGFLLRGKNLQLLVNDVSVVPYEWHARVSFEDGRRLVQNTLPCPVVLVEFQSHARFVLDHELLVRWVLEDDQQSGIIIVGIGGDDDPDHPLVVALLLRLIPEEVLLLFTLHHCGEFLAF